MLKGIKFFGALILNIFAAVLGTAVLESTVGKVFHPHSIATVLWKEWSLSLSCAALIGFATWRRWRMPASKWTWVIPSLWFGLRFVPASIFTRGSVWSQFSGADCDNGLHAVGCQDFFMFTIPFVRGVSYSVGAYFSSLVRPPTLNVQNLRP